MHTTIAQPCGRVKPGPVHPRRKLDARDKEPYVLAPAEVLAGNWQTAGERFLSAFWHARQPGGIELLERFGIEPTFVLTERHFGDRNQWAVCRALTAHTYYSMVPTQGTVRRTAEAVGYVVDSGDGFFDLIRQLPYIETSAAGVDSYGRALLDFARRRGVAVALQAAYRDALDPSSDLSDTLDTLEETIERHRPKLVSERREPCQA